VIVRATDEATLLLDAKLRNSDSVGGLLSSSGVKDLQSYMQEYSLKKGVLLVPDPEGTGCRCEDVTGDGYTIRAIAIASTSSRTDLTLLSRYANEMWNN
jgi:hypothetical protein